MIVAGIASVPARVNSLKLVLDSISPQVDLVIVTLNGHTLVPDYFENYDNLEYRFADNSRGDAEKFVYASRVPDCYYFGCDDDLIYNSTFVSYMIDKCNEYGCPVSLAGKRYKYPVASYHRDFKEYYHCLRDVNEDHIVDVVGTGVLCFRTSQIKVKMEAFETPNMADVWFALQAREQGVQLMCVSHKADYLRHINHDWTIWRNAPKSGKETEVINKLLLI